MISRTTASSSDAKIRDVRERICLGYAISLFKLMGGSGALYCYSVLKLKEFCPLYSSGEYGGSGIGAGVYASPTRVPEVRMFESSGIVLADIVLF